MGIFNRNPLKRMCRRFYRKSGMLYIACDCFFGVKLKEPVLLLVDTGTTKSVLEEKFVTDVLNGIVPYKGNEKIITAQGIIDVKVFPKVIFDDVLGRTFFDDFLVCEHPLTLSELTKETNMSVVGILGTEFMERYSMIINFKTKEIIL